MFTIFYINNKLIKIIIFENLKENNILKKFDKYIN